MAIPGTVPITAPVAPTATGDVYPSHIGEYGKGGLHIAADNTARDAITTERRTEGMLCWSIAASSMFQLDPDMVTWNPYTGAIPADVMLKSVYDPNDDGVVVDSDALQGQAGAYYLDRANHTGAQAQSTITNLVTDLGNKIETSLIGAANGVAPLNGSTLIDNAYLGFSLPLDPVIAWDVVANSPAVSDAGGAAGEVYIVYGSANPTARDLGSGSINWYDGDTLIYDSGTSTFVRIGATGIGVSQVTTALGVQTGPVTIDDTTYIDPSTDRNYVTDDVSAGLAASPNPITAANPAASQADLTSIIVVGNGVFMPELFADGNTLGNGTLRTLTSLGYTNGSAAAIWTRVNSAYTIDVTRMDIDWIAIQEAFLSMQQDGYSKIISPGGRGYCPYATLTLPLDQIPITLNRRGLEFIFDWQGSATMNLTGGDMVMYSRYFTDQSEISGANSYLVDYKYKFENFYGKGNGGNTLADTFIRLGATGHSSFTDIETNSFGCGINAEFCLESMFTNIKHVNYGLYGSSMYNGRWTGAGTSNAQSNVLKVVNHRCVNGSGANPVAGLYMGGNTAIHADTLTFEGFNGAVHHVFYDNPGTQGENPVHLSNLYFENAGASQAAIKFKADKGDFYVSRWNNIVPLGSMGVLVEAEHRSVPPTGVRQLYISLEHACTNQGNGGLPKLRSVTQQSIGYGHFWDVRRVNMPSKPVLNVAANFDTVAPNSYIPQTSQIYYEPSPI